jgi:nucleoside phosphorylase
MRPILILTGIDLEARALARELEVPALRAFGFPVFGRAGVRVAAVGLRATRLQSRWAPLLDGLSRPAVISAGVCGALAPSLATGDVVVPEAVIGLTGERRDIAPPDGIRAALGAPPSGGGCLVTTAHVVATPEAKAALFARTGAVAVDMESSMIVAAAAVAGLPSLVVRGVSDDAKQEVPRALIELLTPAGRVRISRAAALLARPAALSSALDVRRATRRALTAVASALARLTAGIA